MNAYLIIDGGKSFLIDTGAANCWLTTMDLLLQALREAGVAPDSIRNVALTHTHTDHVNGLIAADGSDAFPKLERIFAPEEEVSLCSTSNRLERLSHRSGLPWRRGRIAGGRARWRDLCHSLQE